MAVATTARRALVRWVPDRLKKRLHRARTMALVKMRAEPFSEQLINRYCSGRGLEIGPGLQPMSPPDRTVMLDRFPARLGRAIVSDVVGDGAALPMADESVDYVVSAHMLEHHPDTLAVLGEWSRVLRPGGTMVLVLPHVERTADRGRSTSTLTDVQALHGRDDIDLAHLAGREHYERLGMPAEDPLYAEPRARNQDGSWNWDWLIDSGYVHFHTWTQHEMAEIVSALGFRVLVAMDEMPDRHDSFVVVAAKRAD